MSERDKYQNDQNCIEKQQRQPYVNNYNQNNNNNHIQQTTTTNTAGSDITSKATTTPRATATATVVSSNNNNNVNNKITLNPICSSKAMIVNENVPILSSIGTGALRTTTTTTTPSISEVKENNNKLTIDNKHPINDNKRKMQSATTTMQQQVKNNSESSDVSSKVDNLKLTGRPEKKQKGGFLSRFSGFRFSLRGKKKTKVFENNNPVISENVATTTTTKKLTNKNGEKPQQQQRNNSDYIYIPLRDPLAGDDLNIKEQRINNDDVFKQDTDTVIVTDSHVLTTKPPLPRQPPRVVGVCAKPNQQNGRNLSSSSRHAHQRASSAPREIDVTDHHHHHDYLTSGGGGEYREPLGYDRNTYENQFRLDRMTSGGGRGGGGGCGHGGDHDDFGNITLDGEHKIGLIETNLDTHETIISGKTRSLMELGPQGGVGGSGSSGVCSGTGVGCQRTQSGAAHRINASMEPRRPHKSMEFLLDKENQKIVSVSLFFFIY